MSRHKHSAKTEFQGDNIMGVRLVSELVLWSFVCGCKNKRRYCSLESWHMVPVSTMVV